MLSGDAFCCNSDTETSFASLEAMVRERQLLWFGHIVRKSQDLPKYILYGQLYDGWHWQTWHLVDGQKKQKTLLKKCKVNPKHKESMAADHISSVVMV